MSEHTDKIHDERNRTYLPNHERTIEVQRLDALLRIEELLTSIRDGMRYFAEQLNPKKTPAVETPAIKRPELNEGRPAAEKPVANRRRT